VVVVVGVVPELVQLLRHTKLPWRGSAVAGTAAPTASKAFTRRNQREGVCCRARLSETGLLAHGNAIVEMVCAMGRGGGWMERGLVFWRWARYSSHAARGNEASVQECGRQGATSESESVAAGGLARGCSGGHSRLMESNY
jgi:hypothetical protein